MRGRIGLAVAVVGMVVAAASCAIPITDLGGPSSAAFGINDAGFIVGASQLPDPQPEIFTAHAFRRAPDGTVVDLGTLAGHDNSEARYINGSGTAAGISYGSWDYVPGQSVPAELAPHAVAWDASGRITDLGTLGGLTSEPWDINAAGVIVGESSGRAFVFDPVVGHMAALPDLPGGQNTVALGVNDLGVAVGYTYVDNQTFTPVRWDLDAGTVEDLSAVLDELFVPRQINNKGTMAGEVAGGPPNARTSQAAVVPAGTTTPIHLGVSATEASFAPGLNESDTIVGVHYLPGGPVAYRWSATDGVQQLTTGPSSFALDINEAGTIPGWAADHAVILVAVAVAPGSSAGSDGLANPTVAGARPDPGRPVVQLRLAGTRAFDGPGS